MTTLAERAVACKHWDWLPGMAFLTPADLRVDNQGNVSGTCHPPETYDRPDLADPATFGCLLELVRKAWGEAFHGIALSKDGSVVLFTTPVSFIKSTEYPDLVAALEAAP